MSQLCSHEETCPHRAMPGRELISESRNSAFEPEKPP